MIVTVTKISDSLRKRTGSKPFRIYKKNEYFLCSNVQHFLWQGEDDNYCSRSLIKISTKCVLYM